MNPDHPSLSHLSHPQHTLEVRSWYLIGMFCIVTTLLILGDSIAFRLPVSGEIRSSAGPQKSAADRGHSRILSSHSSENFTSVEEL